MNTEGAETDDILIFDAVQLAARFLGVFIATCFMVAALAPKNGDAGSYLFGVIAMWTISLVLCIIAYLYRSKRRYKQAIITEWLAPVLPLVVYIIAN